ncbi:MAG TPA: NADH-quinone oxidoreductase subunit K, partial [Polyangiaceae bacterium LLY-WYZ-15_(1-7)]|nr:NADH-quinone oxidoreductase subunit K [Polyangiaceae bacterium LLY-WYZ-15_(1-7)]HJL21302.1 NADH-quinone oxidoreductase subunit K [Polyangiaceae bacterium LLY-WYZ-15_(1-7)]
EQQRREQQRREQQRREQQRREEDRAMIWLLAIGIGASVSAGAYLAMSRDLLRCVVGISVLAAAANLVVLASGGARPASPPVIPEGLERLDAAAATPLPQALVLTAIVIGFSLTCFSLIVVLALKQRTGTSDAHDLRAAEPPPEDDGEPALERDPELELPPEDEGEPR